MSTTSEGQMEAFTPPLCTDSSDTRGKRWRWLMVSPIHSEEEARRYYLSTFGRPIDRAREVTEGVWCVGYVTSQEVIEQETSHAPAD